MTKLAVPGRVKTRLARAWGEPAACRIHRAMRACLLRRVQKVVCKLHVTGVLALDEPVDEQARQDREDLLGDFAGYRLVEQGEGDLGQRLARVWQVVGGGPVVFLGTDSPDLPAALLGEAVEAVSGLAAGVALGPACDGGYWTLAAGRFEASLLNDIDWGSDRVYHQTCLRAALAGLAVTVLPTWPDVDEPADVLALRRRLLATGDEDLRQLDRDLDEVCPGSDPVP